MLVEDRGIVLIPQYQKELYARIPIIRRLVFESLLQIERRVIYVVAVGEK